MLDLVHGDAMKLILIRHGETDWNVEGRLQGATDIPLNEKGRRQAAGLALAIRDHSVNRIVSSNLTRAIETARVISHGLDTPFQIDARLRECTFGSLEGLLVAEFKTLVSSHPHTVQDAYDFRPWGGEHREDVITRHIGLLDELCAEDSDGTCVLVGHGRGLMTLLDHLKSTASLVQGVPTIIHYTP